MLWPTEQSPECVEHVQLLRSAVGVAGAAPLSPWVLLSSNPPPPACSLSNTPTALSIMHTDVQPWWNFVTNEGGRNQGRPVTGTNDHLPKTPFLSARLWPSTVGQGGSWFSLHPEQFKGKSHYNVAFATQIWYNWCQNCLPHAPHYQQDSPRELTRSIVPHTLFLCTDSA